MITMAAFKTTNEDLDKASAAKRAFFVNLLDLSWRLFGVMLGPLFIGLYIDSQRTGSGKGFALGGFAIGMVLGVVAIRGFVLKLSKRGSQ
ncbi:hypothetical protein KY385_04785 [Candidatus Parcubacteria bacterium]|nr:hypothetical protein [Candidatus Parcubacteria bacterium]